MAVTSFLKALTVSLETILEPIADCIAISNCWRGMSSFSFEHSFLPKIKECALTGFSMNYTPDGNYQTYENSSMVAYEMSMSFKELEPIYHDEYTALDGDTDESIGF